MRLLDEDRLHLLAAAFRDSKIPKRFRGFRYGDCPPTFQSMDGRISVRQNQDGTWTPLVNRRALRDGEGRIIKKKTPSDAKHDMFVRSSK